MTSIRRKIPVYMRRAGDALRGIDKEYSERIGAMYEGSNPLVQTFGYTVGGAHPSLRKGKLDHFVYGPETIPQRVGREVGEYALPIMNAVPKYVLPTVGVTMAGKALNDLGNSLVGGGDQNIQTLNAMLAAGEITEDQYIRILQQ